MSAPRLGPIKRANGVAGQIAYTVTVTYPGESPSSVTFVSTRVTAGLSADERAARRTPVVMVTEHGQTFVSDPFRFGEEFGPEWVRRFFKEDPS